MTEGIHFRFWNTVVVKKEQQVLLIERNKGDFSGFVPPGGKVEFPETFTDSAICELKEETGLVAKSITLKGVSGFINEIKREQFIFLDYLCTDFTGELIPNGAEGACQWFDIAEIPNLEIKSDIKKRLQLVLEGKNFEYQMFWNELTHTFESDKLFD
ncbi:NUDIX domain-containing protein [Enterococcus sp. JM9B]|uniref:NUDIX domain-containing protein n=1 Tax=Enterococcus sp. JM9B TaxID=1857216 RepID=UPI001374E767|nr:8-oxo-dGTP diphosphatase [Enterococcus sp. JM9B]KAF1302341.1 hypothetical protein BAU16_07325 [Enterococcus sp. JM9B]